MQHQEKKTRKEMEKRGSLVANVYGIGPVTAVTV